MRTLLPLVLLVALSLALPVSAQDGNETGGDGNDTATDDGGNQTDGGAADGGDGGGEPAQPQEVRIELVAAQSGGNWVWEVDGRVNPPLEAPAGATVIFRACGGGSVVPHNLKVGDGPTSENFDGEDCIEYEYTMPESGSVEYVCLIHANTMKGRLRVAAADGGAGDGGEGDAGEDIQGETIDLGQYDAACQGRLAPAIVTQNVVGGPTLQDYVSACAQSEGPVDDSHPADLVLPGSFLLIGLGVLGIVWVHKYYKP